MPSTRRRTALQHLAIAPLALAAPALLAPAQAATARRPTPAQTEGPFYPVDLPADTDHDLLRQGASTYSRGQPGWLEGRLVDTAGTPLPGRVVEIWQCDADGHYRHPGDGDRADPAFQAFGRVTTDAQGGWRFRTIRPVPYGGRTSHIHLKVRHGRRTLLTTQLYVAGDPGNARDFLWRRLSEADRAALTVVFEAGGDGWRAGVEVVVG